MKSKAASLMRSGDVRLRASATVRSMYRRSRSEISKSWMYVRYTGRQAVTSTSASLSSDRRTSRACRCAAASAPR